MRAIVLDVNTVELYAENDADSALLDAWATRLAQVREPSVGKGGAELTGLGLRFGVELGLVEVSAEPPRPMSVRDAMALAGEAMALAGEAADGGGRC